MKVDELLSRNEFGALVFDSVCTLFSQGNKMEVLDFLKKLSIMVSVANCECVFLAIKPRIKAELLEELNMVADKVVHLDST